MKDVIKTKLRCRRADSAAINTDMLVVGAFSDAKKPSHVVVKLNKLLDGSLVRPSTIGDFNAKAGSSVMTYTDDVISAKRILLVGLGKKGEVTLDVIRKAAQHAGEKVSFDEWEVYGQTGQALQFLDECTDDQPFALFVSLHPHTARSEVVTHL